MSDEAGEPSPDGGTDARRSAAPAGADVDTDPADGRATPTDERRTPEPDTAVVTTGDTTVIARTVARAVVPVVLLLAVSLTLRGHNLPGGGFIGGVLTAIAVTLLYAVFGLGFVHDRLGSDRLPRTLFGAGLAIAFVSGLGPLVLGGAFLQQAFVVLPEPLPGPFYHEFEVASALAFDLGVYLVVVGGLLTVVGEVSAE